MSQTYKDFEIEEHKRMGASDIEFSFYTVKGFIGREFASIQSAKVAITKHLTKKAEFDRINALPEIEVVPRTQQEIDDYGPNGIQPPKSILSEEMKKRMEIFEVDVDVIRGKINHPNATVHPIPSRNKREGGYCGRYKAGDKNFKMAHYRVGPKGEFDTLKQSARFYKELRES